MTDYLDEQLDAAAPPLHTRTIEMQAATRELIDATERATSLRSRPQLRVAAAAVSVTAVMGAGTAAAAAAGWTPTPWWEGAGATAHESTGVDGQHCVVSYAPRAFRDPAHPVTKRDRARAMEAAADFLERIDFATLAGADPDTVHETLTARLDAALRRGGYSPYAVSVALSTNCDSGPDQ